MTFEFGGRGLAYLREGDDGVLVACVLLVPVEQPLAVEGAVPLAHALEAAAILQAERPALEISELADPALLGVSLVPVGRAADALVEADAGDVAQHLTGQLQRAALAEGVA